MRNFIVGEHVFIHKTIQRLFISYLVPVNERNAQHFSD